METDEQIERRACERDQRQHAVATWCRAAFGEEHATNLLQRAVRGHEEQVELLQAAAHETGADMAAARAMAHKQVDYVFDRPPGNLRQEVGGVSITLLALCAAAGFSADEAESAELQRILAKPLSHFAARNEAKNAAGFNVVAPMGPQCTHRWKGVANAATRGRLCERCGLYESSPTDRKAFPAEVVLSIVTGRLLCAFTDMKDCFDWMAGSQGMSDSGCCALKEPATRVILALHPELQQAIDEENEAAAPLGLLSFRWAQRYGATIEVPLLSEADARPPRDIGA